MPKSYGSNRYVSPYYASLNKRDTSGPKYIDRSFTAEEVEAAVAPLKQRIAELEAQLKTKH